MSFDLEKLLRLDMGYPGLSFGYHSWALGAYLDSLENFISLAQEQYRVRAKRSLESKRDEYDSDHYAQEENYTDEAADEHIPRYARMAALVPIWGLFESSITDITAYVSKREGAKLQLKEIRAQNFREQVEKYYDGVLGLHLPWSEEEKENIAILHTVRNALAHRNGHFSDAPPDRITEVEKAVKNTSGLSILGGDLVVSAEYVRSSAELVFKVLGDLNQMVSDRYDGPTAPNKKA